MIGVFGLSIICKLVGLLVLLHIHPYFFLYVEGYFVLDESFYWLIFVHVSEYVFSFHVNGGIPEITYC